MAKKQGGYALDSSKYGTLTDGEATLVVVTTTAGAAKQRLGSQAPDGSIYFCLSDGAANLV